jgi:hypothetical protein
VKSHNGFIIFCRSLTGKFKLPARRKKIMKKLSKWSIRNPVG